MGEKRYYWLKLNEDYFNSPKIKKLRKIAGGDTYTIIYLKLQLLSISNNGVLSFEGIENTFEEELALKLDEDVEDVKVTILYLQSQGLIESNSKDFLLVEACKNIGSECDSAKRVREFREKKEKMEIEMGKNAKALQCNASVTEVLRSSISISNSISNSNIIKDNNDNNIDICKELIEYLNEKAKTHYRQVESNYKHIRARLKDFSVEDIKTVIDKKCKEWIGTEFERYLTPETLFRPSNFEKYLNQHITEKKNPKDANKREYTKEQLDSFWTPLDEIEI